ANLLLDVVGTLGTATGLAALSAGLPLARSVYDSVRGLFGAGQAQALTGTRIGLDLEGSSGRAPDTAGHFAFTSLPKVGYSDAPFRVEKRRLKPIQGVVQ